MTSADKSYRAYAGAIETMMRASGGLPSQNYHPDFDWWLRYFNSSQASQSAAVLGWDATRVQAELAARGWVNIAPRVPPEHKLPNFGFAYYRRRWRPGVWHSWSRWRDGRPAPLRPGVHW